MRTCLQAPYVNYLHTQQLKHWLASLDLHPVCQVTAATDFEGGILTGNVYLLKEFTTTCTK